MLKDIYMTRRRGAWALLLAAAAVVAFFIYFSASLVADLAQQERQRMELWADATRRLAADTGGDGGGGDVDFMLTVIEANTNIPVLLADEDDNILFHRNFNLPVPPEDSAATALSDANAAFLRKKIEKMRRKGNIIDISIDGATAQHLYYDDSTLLHRLSYYPYVQTLVMIAFVATVYFAVTATKKAEQNKVWVGLSKETAHQLGTPISSLMAWTQMLSATGTDPTIVDEMDRDINRLAAIASRFSKVGSRPGLEPEPVDALVCRCTDYMRTRIADSVNISADLNSGETQCAICAPLMEWVMENLIKNAVDAMDGIGSIRITTALSDDNGGRVIIEVSDTGKGLPRKLYKTIFRPGYTTKRRGWGLGLTLAKRITEEYHHGKIFVKTSEPGKGTTFRIELPALPDQPL